VRTLFVLSALLALAAALSLGGCGGAPEKMPGAAQVELGTAASDGTGFLPLSGDQTLVPGAQGGFHVWVKWKVEGLSPEKVHAQRTVRRTSDNALILTTEGAVEVGDPSDGWWELPSALPSFMCPTPIGVRVQDEEVKFDLVITADDNGEPGAKLGETTATATPRCPGDSEMAFCQQICDG
jgi:hypothetical protein